MPIAKPIAVVEGAESAANQQLLPAVCSNWQHRARIVGVSEDPLGDVCGCGPEHLRNLVGGRSYPMFQDLGLGSSGCSLAGPSGQLGGQHLQPD